MRKRKLGSLLVVIAAAMCFSFAACTGASDSTSMQPITVTLSKNEAELDLYESTILTAEVANTEEAVVWSSSDETVAAVEGGKVTALKEGVAIISATVNEASDKCTLTVNAPDEEPTLTLNETSMSLNKGESDVIQPTLTYKGGELDAAYSYESSAPAIVSVSAEGVAEGVAVGAATVTVTATYLTFTAVCEVSVTVLDNVSLALSEENVRMAMNGGAKTITVTVTENGKPIENPEIVWTAEYIDVVTVENGVLTPVGEGESEVTAEYTSEAGKKYTAKLNVEVYFTETDKGQAKNPINLDKGAEGASAFAELDLSDVGLAAESIRKITDISGERTSIIDFETSENKLMLKKAHLTSGERTLRIYYEQETFTLKVIVATKILKTAEHVINLKDYLEADEADTNKTGGYFLLGNNIDMNNANVAGIVDTSGFTAGTGYKDQFKTVFNGMFDGRGYSISNFNIHQNFGSLFGKVEGGTIRNVAFVNADVTAPNNAAVIAFVFGGGSVMQDVFVNGSIAITGESGDIPGQGVFSSLGVGFAETGCTIKNVFGVLDGYPDKKVAGGIIVASINADSYIKGEHNIVNVYSLNVRGLKTGWKDTGGWLDYDASEITPPNANGDYSWSALGNSYAGRNTNYLHTGVNATALRITDSHLLALLKGTNVANAGSINERVALGNVRSFQSCKDYATWRIDRANGFENFDGPIWNTENAVPVFANGAEAGKDFTITNTVKEVIRGNSLQLTADTYVRWSLKEEVEGITIDENGLLTASAAIAEPITVTVAATSLFGITVFEEITVSVIVTVDKTGENDAVVFEGDINGKVLADGTVTGARDSLEIDLNAVPDVGDVAGVAKIIIGGRELDCTVEEKVITVANQSSVLPIGENLILEIRTANCLYKLKVNIYTSIIQTEAEFRAMDTDNASRKGHYILANDINFNNATLNLFSQNFLGIIDGNGFAVKNASVSGGSADNALLGNIGGTMAADAGIVRNLQFLGIKGATGDNKGGAIFNWIRVGGRVENIYVEIVLTSSQQKSGLARGVFNASAIKNCIVSVNADGATGNTGLLISDASRAGTLTNVFAISASDRSLMVGAATPTTKTVNCARYATLGALFEAQNLRQLGFNMQFWQPIIDGL